MFFHKALFVGSSLILSSLVSETSAAAVRPLVGRDVIGRAPEVKAVEREWIDLEPFPAHKLYSATPRRRQAGNDTTVSEAATDNAAQGTGMGQSDMSLQMKSDMYWSMKGSSVPIAKLTMGFQSDQGTTTPAANGRVMNLENLMDNVAGVTCSSQEMQIKWKDEQSYNNAKTSWNWVNGDTNRYIGMMVNSPGCGGKRQPYKVTKYITDDNSKSMRMTATAEDWEKVYPFMDMHLNTKGVAQQSVPRGLEKRDSSSLSLAKEFSKNFLSQDVDNVNVALTCGGCNTMGELDIEGDINLLPPKAVITITPKGVSATIGLDLVVTGALNTAFEKGVSIVSVPIGVGLNIGPVGFGPMLEVDLDAKLTNVTAAVDLGLGSVTLAIPDESSVTVDAFSPKNDKVSGFSPMFSAQGPSVNSISAGASVSASFGPNIILGLEGKAFGEGIGFGLALAAPALDATASINENGCSGLEFDAGLSAQLNAFAGIGDLDKVAAESTISLIGTSTQIFSTCLTIPGGAAASPSSGASPSGDAPAASPTDNAPASTTSASPLLTALPAQGGNPPSSTATVALSTVLPAQGGTGLTTLSDASCKSLGATNSAPGTCAPAGASNPLVTLNTVPCGPSGFTSLCCPTGTTCNSVTVGGVSGQCCQ